MRGILVFLLGLDIIIFYKLEKREIGKKEREREKKRKKEKKRKEREEGENRRNLRLKRD